MNRAFMSILCLLLLIVSGACATETETETAAGVETAAPCDRACLEGFVDQYLAALVAHDASQLPLTENARYTRQAFRMQLISAVSSPFTEVLGASVAAGLVWFVGRDVLAGRAMTADDFIKFVIFLFSAFKPLKSLTGVNNALQTGIAAAQRIFAILDRPPEPVDRLGTAGVVSFTNDIHHRRGRK